jgi:ribosomal protein L37AE/L43A
MPDHEPDCPECGSTDVERVVLGLKRCRTCGHLFEGKQMSLFD